MDQLLHSNFDANLNLLVLVALVFLAFALIALMGAACTLVPQVHRTLNAYEKLADTLEKELSPTLSEVNKVLIGVQEIRAIAGQRMTEVGTKVEDVTDNLAKAADKAKKHSSVWGAGLLAGARAYFASKNAAKRESIAELNADAKKYV